MRGLLLGIALALTCAGSAFSQPRTTLTWPTPARFASDAEFMSYLRAVERAQAEARGRQRQPKSDPSDLCPPELYPCDPAAADDENQEIIVTGSRIAAPASVLTSITNVQNIGVDEGDIVKLYGRFLIVLQDGRLFSVDTGSSPGEMRVIDRANVYRSVGADVWYDEILVHDNRVVVTGFNYGESATEFSVFSIGENGRFTREGAYFLSSDDYYDTENYATRLVNGALVIYTPLKVSEVDTSGAERPRWPLVRRWLREGEDRALTTTGRPLFDARDIYRPIQYTLEPTIHTLSICPLGSPRADDELNCRSTAIMGPPARQFYVSTEHIYLWLWPGEEYPRRAQQEADCEARANDEFLRAVPSALFQLPLAEGGPGALFVRGAPWDQLSMDANAGEFRALSVWTDPQCWPFRENDEDDDLRVRYFSAPLGAVSAAPSGSPASAFTPLPDPGGRAIENRFTNDYLVYGARSSWSSYAPPEEARQSARIVAAPTARPGAAVVIEAPHNVLRVERVGDNAIAAGYGSGRGLSISLIDLGAAPRLASTAFLAGRYESEGRSHAFNSVVGEDGAGLMGLPTIERRWVSGRWWWRSEAYDVSFVSLDAAGDLRSVGPLLAHENAQHPSYRCQVSCIDWYGNSRPIFIAGRVFALSGVELIEGKLERGAIVERGRVNLSAPVSAR